MRLDLPTLLVLGSIIAATSAAILLSTWWLQPKNSAVALWWAGASFVNATSVPLLGLRGTLPDFASIVLGPAALAVAAAMYWTAARVFDRKAIRPLIAVSGLIAWFVGTSVPVLLASDVLRQSLIGAIVSAYLVGAAAEIWRARAEPLYARKPLIGLLVVHAATFFAAVVALDATFTGRQGPSLGGFGAFQFLEFIVFTIATSVFVVALVRERSALQNEIDGRIDSLTGLANRGWFTTRARLCLAEAADAGTPVSAILFDLDHFKSINDTFGHRMGDRVMEYFATAIVDAVRETDIVGRIGGEEFAVILPGRSAEAAHSIAERIRATFATACRSVEGVLVKASVSAGAAEAAPGSSLEALLGVADDALYTAKSKGRNRVQLAEESGRRSGDKVVARIG